MKIGKRDINIANPPFIIAELSANHNNDIRRALKLVDEAKEQEQTLLKFKLILRFSTLNSKNKFFKITDKNSLWYNRYLYDLYKEGSMPWKWHKEFFLMQEKKNNMF